MVSSESKFPQLNIAGKLLVNGEQFRLGQIRRDSLILQAPRDVAPCAAELVVTVRGQDTVYPIYLPDGISSQSETVPFQL